jgi:hypothetical protein
MPINRQRLINQARTNNSTYPSAGGLGGANLLKSRSAPSNPADTISQKMRGLSQAAFNNMLIFPNPLPPVHFNLIEAHWSIGGAIGNVYTSTNIMDLGKLTSKGMYRLPLPMQLQDSFKTNYNDDTSLGKIAKNFIDGVKGKGGSTLGKIANAIGGTSSNALQQLTGVLLNEVRFVSMNQPSFKRHQLSWVLSPNNPAEAQTLNKIRYGLQKGSTPRIDESYMLLKFPRIYIPFITPNSHYLMKFKPCVIEQVSVTFNGMGGHSFYRGMDNVSDKAPQSMSLAISLLELEIWVDSDNPGMSNFNMDNNGQPTAAPLDTWNWYSLDSVLNPNTGISGTVNTIQDAITGLVTGSTPRDDLVE